MTPLDTLRDLLSRVEDAAIAAVAQQFVNEHPYLATFALLCVADLVISRLESVLLAWARRRP